MVNIRTMGEDTTVQLKKTTRERLAKLGTVSSTYDSVINELIDHAENCDLKETRVEIEG